MNCITNILALVLCLLLAFNVAAQEDVEVRKLNQQQLDQIIGNEDYHYGRKDLSGAQEKKSTERMQEFLRSLEEERKEQSKSQPKRKKRKRSSGNSSDGGGGFFGVLQYLLIVLVIIVVVYGLIQTRKTPVLTKSDEELIGFDYNISGDRPEELDEFEIRIREAIQQQNFREAVRLHFLRILGTMSDKKLIDWQIDKTNYDYYLEVKGTDYEADFMAVSINFEYVWYGEFPIEIQQYLNLVKQFDAFRAKLNQPNG